jgi:exodeoxyribonuclease-3
VVAGLRRRDYGNQNMKVATWNVNSIRARVELVLDWLRRAEPDVLCMQETKVVDDDFPTDELQRLGYAVAMAGQRTYNGVAIASRLPMREISVGLYDDGPGADRRLISASVSSTRILCAYVPNGRSVDSPAFGEKIDWLRRLRHTLDRGPGPETNVIVCGDFNIAPDERDLFDPEERRGQLHFHPDEHAALKEVLDFGLVDAYRHHHHQGGQYSWWDYRGGAFRRNAGMRLDFVLITRSLAERCRAAYMDVDERRRPKPSDHIPVVVEFA